MRIVFLGAGEFGLPTLRALVERHDVRLVVTQPDRPAGRRRRPTPTPIARWAEERGLDVIKPEKVNTDEVVERVRAAEPEANVVVAFGQLVGRRLIESPSYGAIGTMNLHASLLPKYRGAAPINWAVLEGERETGNTVFQLVRQMDAGAILGQQRTQIDPLETAGEVHDRLAEMGPELVQDVLNRLETGEIEPREQDEAEATLAPKLSRADGWVDFAESAERVRCRVHGLTPWPGVSCWWAAEAEDGGGAGERNRLLLRRVEALPEYRHDAEPGVMVEDGVVATGQGAVRLLEVQPPGKKAMPWADFARGHRVGQGVRFFGSEDGGAAGAED